MHSSCDLQEAVAEEHLGKRRAELNWKIHRIHWEKNRFIYDLMYVRKVMSKELVRMECMHLLCTNTNFVSSLTTSFGKSLQMAR